MKYSVIQEQTINAAIEDVLKNIIDFKQWQYWSPWAVLDPGTIYKYDDDFMQWAGKFTGAGNMRLVASCNGKVKIDLDFIKPFKSKANVEFILEQLPENKTKVIWKMNSQLPIFLIFFKKMFQVMISRDFQRGLIRLKYKVEYGHVPMKVTFFDEPEYVPGFQFTGFSNKCQFSNISPSMKSSFMKLRSLINDSKITANKMLCFSDKVKICKNLLYYTVGVIHTGDAINTSTLKNKIIPEHKVIKVSVTGNYDFMGDAWTGIYSHLRGQKLKQNKKIAPYEICIKGPDDTDDPNEYVTEVYMPVR